MLETLFFKRLVATPYLAGVFNARRLNPRYWSVAQRLQGVQMAGIERKRPQTQADVQTGRLVRIPHTRCTYMLHVFKNAAFCQFPQCGKQPLPFPHIQRAPTLRSFSSRHIYFTPLFCIPSRLSFCPQPLSFSPKVGRKGIKWIRIGGACCRETRSARLPHLKSPAANRS